MTLPKQHRNGFVIITTPILLLFIFIVSCNSLTQPNTLQVAHVNSLLTSSRQAMIDVDIPASTQLAFEALTYSRKVNYHHGYIRATYLVGQNLFNAGLHNQALGIINDMDTTHITPADALYLAQIYKVQGQIYYISQETEASLQTFDAALIQARQVEDRSNGDYITSQIYESKAVVYNGLDDYQTALNYLLRNHDLLEQMDEAFVFNNKINNYTLLGEQYLHFSQPDSSAYWLNQATRLIDKYNYTYQSRALMAKAQMYMEQNPHDAQAALEQLYLAQQNLKETGFKFELPKLYELIAAAFELQGQTASELYFTVLKEEIREELSQNKNSVVTDAVNDVVDNYYRQLRAKRLYRIYTIGAIVMIALSIVLLLTLRSRQRT